MRLVLLIVILSCAVLVSGLGLAYSKHQHRALYRKLDALHTRQLTLQLEWQALTIRQSALSSLIKVDRKARQQLEMIDPSPTDVMYLTP